LRFWSYGLSSLILIHGSILNVNWYIHLKSITEPWNILNGPKAVVAEASAEQAKEVAGRIHPEKDSTLSFVAE